MIEDSRSPCSPYLLKERRDLAVACRQISRAHGQESPPCGACALKDVCRQRLQATLIPAPRPRGAPSNDPGATKAAA